MVRGEASETVRPDLPEVSAAVDHEHLGIRLHRRVEARDLAESLAETDTRVHLRRLVDRANLQHYPALLQLREPVRTERIPLAVLLPEDQLLQQIAVSVGDRDLVGHVWPGRNECRRPNRTGWRATRF